MRTHKRHKMKTYTYKILTALLATVLLSSCLKEDEEVTLSDDCYISAFSLGNVRRTNHITGSKGQDSIFYTAFSAATIPMIINQRENTIENAIPLPYGSIMSKVLTNCSFEGILMHRPANTNTDWIAYDAKDSLDFTSPREFRVVSTDGSASRQYTVKISAYQEDPDATKWDSLSVNPALASCQTRRLVPLNNTLTALVQLEDGTLKCFSRSATILESEWVEKTVENAGNALLESMQADSDTLYMSTSDGKILYSLSGNKWNEMMTGKDGLKLVGVSSKRLYAMVDGKLVSSPKDQEAWEDEELDDKASNLPTTNICALNISQANGNQRLFLTGTTADGKSARLWSKVWIEPTISEKSACWSFYESNPAIKNTFPVLNQSCVIAYANSILLFGGKDKNKSEESSQALSCTYVSRDLGITWQTDSPIKFDDRMVASASDAQLITATTQDEKYIWILIDGQLWRGQLNKLANK